MEKVKVLIFMKPWIFPCFQNSVSVFLQYLKTYPIVGFELLWLNHPRMRKWSTKAPTSSDVFRKEIWENSKKEENFRNQSQITLSMVTISRPRCLITRKEFLKQIRYSDCTTVKGLVIKHRCCHQNCKNLITINSKSQYAYLKLVSL